MTKRFIKLLISIFVYSFDSLNKKIRSISGVKQPSTCVILYYHVVKPEQRHKFATQMEDLLKLARPVFAERLHRVIDGHNYVAVTFDDGYSSILENALPELMRRNIPVTMFIPSGCLGDHPPWIDKRSEEYQEVVMTAQQLRSLDTSLITLGSHCVTHRNLLQLSKEEAEKEIVQSKNDLERILGMPIESISFPHGAFNQLHVDMARQAAYRYAFSILPELTDMCSDNFIMGRVRVDPTDWQLEYQLKLLGAYRWLVWIAALKKNFIQTISRGSCTHTTSVIAK